MRDGGLNADMTRCCRYEEQAGKLASVERSQRALALELVRTAGSASALQGLTLSPFKATSGSTQLFASPAKSARSLTAGSPLRGERSPLRGERLALLQPLQEGGSEGREHAASDNENDPASAMNSPSLFGACLGAR